VRLRDRQPSGRHQRSYPCPRGLCSAPVSADISVGGQYAGITLLVADGYLSYLEVYSIGEPVRRLPPLEVIHPRPAR